MESRLRICLLSAEYPPMQGGVGDYTRQLALALAARGHDTHVVTSRGAGGESGESRPEGERVSVHPIVEHWGWGCWAILRRFVRRLRPDVLHIQYQSAAYDLHPAVNLLPLYTRFWAERPLTAVCFHDLRVPYIFPKAGPLRWRSVVALARAANVVIATNSEDERTLARCGLGSRLVEIPIGSNIQSVLPADYDRGSWRARWGVGDHQVLLSYFGFLNESKGGEELIRSLDRMMQGGYNAKLLMVGGKVGSSDPTNRAYLRRVEALIDQLRLADHVSWTGYVPPTEVTASLVASDICVLPYRDGVSFRRGSFMAALAHGVPIVTTVPQVNLPDLVDGENVCLVPPEDVKALAEAIVQLAESPDLRRVVGEGARLLSRSFEWESIAQRTLEAYHGCIRG